MKASKTLFDLVISFLAERSEYIFLPQQNGIFPTLGLGDLALSINDDGLASISYQDSYFSFSKEETDSIWPLFEKIYDTRIKERDKKLVEKAEKRLIELSNSTKLIKETKV